MTRYLFPSRVVENENRGLLHRGHGAKFFRRHRYAPLFHRALMGVTLSIRDSRLRQWREKLRWWMSWETWLCAPLPHCRNRSCNWRRYSRSSVVSSCAKYANVCYIRSGNALATKTPPDSLLSLLFLSLSLSFTYTNWRSAKEEYVVAQHILIWTVSCARIRIRFFVCD